MSRNSPRPYLEARENCQTTGQGGAGRPNGDGDQDSRRAEAETALKCLVQNTDSTLAELERLRRVCISAHRAKRNHPHLLRLWAKKWRRDRAYRITQFSNGVSGL